VCYEVVQFVIVFVNCSDGAVFFFLNFII
jgi:hypothetical protein